MVDCRPVRGRPPAADGLRNGVRCWRAGATDHPAQPYVAVADPTIAIPDSAG